MELVWPNRAARAVVAVWLTVAGALSEASAAAITVAQAGQVQPGSDMLFVARRTTRWRLDLSHRIPLNNLRLTYRGDGRVFGYLLVEEGAPLGRGSVLGGYSIGRCGEQACNARPSYKFQFAANVDSYLPSGSYFVYLIADGAPVRLRLQTPASVDGTPAREGEAVRTHIRTLTTATPTTRNVYSGGRFAPPSNKSLFGLFGLWLEGSSHAASAYGDCFYFRGDIFSSRTPTFQPGCPTGDGFHHTFVGSDPTGGAETVFVSARLSAQVPVTGIGGWYSSISDVAASGAVAAWVDVRSE